MPELCLPRQRASSVLARPLNPCVGWPGGGELPCHAWVSEVLRRGKSSANGRQWWWIHNRKYHDDDSDDGHFHCARCSSSSSSSCGGGML